MGQIVTLDQNMVNMIAAGEVIERPANVVKELMENSIDAGATKITVSVEDGGRKSISLIDNGCGMDAEDLSAAFEPHATAQVRAVSRTEESAGANFIEIDCGDKGSLGPCSAACGTTIKVRDIFYKLPARRKFLRTANTEMTHITEHFTRIALANTNLDMTLTHNSRELYHLTAGQGIRRRITELFSLEISENLIETKSDEKTLQLFALLGRPDIARANKKFQYAFLNGRFIRDKFISHAITEAYRGILQPDRFPVVFLYIRMPYEDVDVNVHPTKIEVRFYNANLVHSQILGCLRERLLASDLETQAKIPAAAAAAKATYPDAGSAGPASKEVADAMAEFFKKHRPVQSQQHFGYRSQMPARSRAEPTEPQKQKAVQIHDSYIVAETDDGFIIIDQHALHERIIYQDLSRRIHSGRLESQKLLMPESFELTDAQADAVRNQSEIIEKLGLELAPFGPKTMAVQAFPTILENVEPLDFVQDLLDLLTDKELTVDTESLLARVLNMAACKAAIKAGQRLSDAEIEQLLEDRNRLEYTARCPHGRPTVIKFTLKELEKQFKRT